MINKFLNARVQTILKNITGFELEKIFSSKPTKRLTAPKYMFLTDDDYNRTIENCKLKAQYYLRMPPVMEPIDPEKSEVLEKDDKLEGYVDKYGHSNFNLVFTDISPNNKDRSRIMVIRQPDGTLRRANFRERQRLNSIYFPHKYRTVDIPKMFEEDNLENVLKKPNTSLFVLERACLQYEPDDPDYIRITHRVYEHILNNRAFNELRSTRHFGPFAFYLAINKKIDLLIKDQLDRHLIEDALNTIELYYLVNDKSTAFLKEMNEWQIIEKFIKEDCGDYQELMSSFENLKDKKEEQKS